MSELSTDFQAHFQTEVQEADSFSKVKTVWADFPFTKWPMEEAPFSMITYNMHKYKSDSLKTAVESRFFPSLG